MNTSFFFRKSYSGNVIHMWMGDDFDVAQCGWEENDEEFCVGNPCDYRAWSFNVRFSEDRNEHAMILAEIVKIVVDNFKELKNKGIEIENGGTLEMNMDLFHS